MMLRSIPLAVLVVLSLSLAGWTAEDQIPVAEGVRALEDAATVPQPLAMASAPASARLFAIDQQLVNVDAFRDQIVAVSADDASKFGIVLCLPFNRSLGRRLDVEPVGECLARFSSQTGGQVLVLVTGHREPTLLVRQDANPADARQLVEAFATHPELSFHVIAEPQVELWIVRRDWSQSPQWDQISRELQATSGETSTSDPDGPSPSSASDVVFPSKLTVMYTPEHAAALRSWLTSRGLLEIVPATIRPDSRQGFPWTIVTASTAELGIALPAPEPERFVERSYQWRFQINWAQDPQNVQRALLLAETWKGAVPSQSEAAHSYFDLSVPDGYVGIADAFVAGNWAFAPETRIPGDMFRSSDRISEGGKVLLVLAQPEFGKGPVVLGTPAEPELRLPDRVSPTLVEPALGAPPEGLSPFSSGRRRGGRGDQGPRESEPSSAHPDAPRPDAVPAAVAETARIEFKVFTLHFANAESTITLLNTILPGKTVRFVADARTNTVIATGDAETLTLAEALLERLDTQPPAAAMSKSASAVPGDPSSRTGTSLDQLKRQYERHENEAQRIAGEIRDQQAGGSPETNAKAGDRTVLTSQLRKAVDAAFRARQQLLNAELQQMQMRLQHSRESLELRSTVADQIVDRRVEDLLNPDLKWEPPAAATSAAASVPLPTPDEVQFVPAAETTAPTERYAPGLLPNSMSLPAAHDARSSEESPAAPLAALKAKLRRRVMFDLESDLGKTFLDESSQKQLTDQIDRTAVRLGQLQGFWASEAGAGERVSHGIIHDDLAAEIVDGQVERMWRITISKNEHYLFKPLDDRSAPLSAFFLTGELQLLFQAVDGNEEKPFFWRKRTARIPDDDWNALLEAAAAKQGFAQEAAAPTPTLPQRALDLSEEIPKVNNGLEPGL